VDPRLDPVSLLVQNARTRPRATWLVQPQNGREIRTSFGDAAQQVARMAGALRAMGFAPGSRICITGMNTAHWFLADLAITMAGHVSVGIYPKQARATTRYIFEHSEAKAVFIGPAFGPQDDLLAALPEGVVKIGLPYAGVPPCDHRWDELVRKHSAIEHTPPSPEAIWTIVYTSGTTGDPKGVMLSFGALTYAGERLRKVMPLGDKPRWFSYLPLAHLMERAGVELASLHYGGQVYFLEAPEKLAHQLRRASPSMFVGVPLVYARLQGALASKIPPRVLTRVFRTPGLRRVARRLLLELMGLANARILFVGGASIPVPLLEWFELLGLPLLQAYGMTETSAYATFELPDQRRLGSVGKPAPDAEVKLSEDGEILVRHGALMLGYFRDPDQTRDAFTADGFMRTGDKGRFDNDGFLYVTGRVKDIFKTRKGRYVAPARVEGALASSPVIDQVCLVGANLNQPLMLVSLNAAGRAKRRAELEQELITEMTAANAALESHEQIAKCVIVKDTWTIEAGHLTPTMKVRRQDIEHRYRALIEQQAETRVKIGWE
jgi:long-chain acyl-CoA synthetase